MNRQELRQQMRAKRSALGHLHQDQASERIYRLFHNNPLFTSSQRIGFYLASDGEISCRHLLDAALKAGKECFLPVLHPIEHNRLWFVRYEPGCPMTVNKYGIEEPDMMKNPRIQPWSLNLVLLPLVAFDAEGGRMGMGGGYYDRTFEFTRKENPMHTPTLLGLAHELQRVEKLELASWDIPLAGIISDKQLYMD